MQAIYSSFDHKDNISNVSSVEQEISQFLNDNPYASPEEMQLFFSSLIKKYPSGDTINLFNSLGNDYYNNLRSSIYEGLNNDSLSGQEALNQGGRSGLTGYDASLQDLISNTIARENAETSYNREKELRDTSLESTYAQAQALGLNPSGSVMSLGGATASPVGQASNPSLSAAGLAHQKKLNEYKEKQAMTRQLIHMATSLAAAGVGGATWGAARGAVNLAARSTVGAAKQAISSSPKRYIKKDKGHEDDPDSWYIF